MDVGPLDFDELDRRKTLGGPRSTRSRIART
jgi:hypothetical protein